MFLDWDARYGGTAFAHPSRARSLDPQNKRIREIGKNPRLAPLGLDNIVRMLQRIEYLPRLVAEMVRVTKLDFRLDLDNEEQVAQIKKLKLAAVVLEAMLCANRRVGVADGGAGGAAPEQGGGKDRGRAPRKPATPKRTRPKIDPHTAALAGTYTARTNIAVLPYKLTLVMDAQGKWTLTTDGGFVMRGSFSADGRWIEFITDEQSHWVSDYRVENRGRTLVIAKVLGYVKPIRFTKQ